MFAAICVPIVICFLISTEVTFFTIIFVRFFGCHLLLIVAIYQQQIFTLTHFQRNILKKTMQTNISTKNVNHSIMQTTDFFNEGRFELSLALFKIGHLFLSIFT